VPLRRKPWRPPSRPWTHTWHVRFMEKSDTRGTTVLRPMKMPHISTMCSDGITTGGTINPTCKEVIQISTPISIRINHPWKTWS
jgi:hypothetical protein